MITYLGDDIDDDEPHPPQLCICGSGLIPEWLYDARGIELCKACPSCREERLLSYRPDVLINPQYEADEPIEPEDY